MISQSNAKVAGPNRTKPRTRRTWSDDQILAAAELSVPRTPPPAGYVIALGLLATALIFVPLVYLGLVVFLAWLFVWHAGQTFTSLSLGPFFIFHVPMAILGGILIVFLVKPVFFRGRKTDQGVLTLKRQEQPLLFAFVDKTCDSVGVVAPTVIEVDCEPNAHASMRGRRLRIGLPLVAAFSLDQLGGVLAHEFGHFNQLAGRNSAYLIRRLMHFFALVVFQRDKLDAWLLNLRSRRSGASRLVYYVIAGPIEAVRGLLWLMLIGSELLTCRVLRHMEYDADILEAHIAGIDNFVRVSKLFAFLGIASERARQDLAGALDQLRLADDLPRLIVASAKQLVGHRTDILASLDQQKTNWFDTHPCHADRVRNVRATGAVGLLNCDEPARRLFVDFDGLCKAATTSFYQAVLGENFAAVKLVPSAELAAETAGQRQTMKALRRYFQDQVIIARPIIPGPQADRPPENIKAAIVQLRSMREAMVSAAEDLGDLSRQYCSAEATLLGANATVDLCNLFPGNPRIYSLRLRGVTDQNRNEKILADARQRLPGFEQAATERLSMAISLLAEQAVRAKIASIHPQAGDSSRPEFAGLLIGVLREMRPFLPAVNRLRQATVVLRVHLSAFNPKRRFPPLGKKIIGISGDIVRKLTKLKTDLETLPYPFEHGLNVGAVGDVLVQDLPDAGNPVAVCNHAGRVIARFDLMMVRMIGSLSEWAEKVETAVGLDVLAEPPDREDTRDLERQAAEKRNTRKYWRSYGQRAAGGLVMLIGLVWLSASPPALPGWGDQSGVSYRPAAFTVAESFAPARPQFRIGGNGWMPAMPHMPPMQPPMIQTPSFQPWQPTMTPRMQPPQMPQIPTRSQPMFQPMQPQLPSQPFVPRMPQFDQNPFTHGLRSPQHPVPGSMGHR